MTQRACISVLIATVTAPTFAGARAVVPPAPPAPRILVFTKTAGFRHASIPTAVSAVRELGRRTGLVVDATEDAAAFTTSGLARYEAVVFLLTTGDVLDEGQQNALRRFFRAGGGFAGVHSAADTEYGWAWYGTMLGAYFKSHPQIQVGAVEIERRRHPSTAGLPRRWVRRDEWYNFSRNPRLSVRVLATLDESSYAPGDGAMGRDHPITWAHELERGRAWFTGGGHTSESYSEPLFRRHLIGGIRYAAGLTPPRILSVTSIVRRGRLTVAVEYRSCLPCAGELRVGALAVPLRLRAGSGHARSPRLARGRRRFTVALEDPGTGLRDVVRRQFRVR